MIRNPLEDFAAYQRGKGLSERTIENREYTLRALERGAGRTVLEVDIYDIRAHLGRLRDGRPLTPGSKQTERDTLVAFFKFAKLEGFRPKNPTKRLPAVRAPRGEPRPYSQAQIDALLSTGAYRRTRVMILLSCYQGLRAGSVARVHGHDFDYTSNTMRVVGKGGKVAHLPLHPLVRDLALTMPQDDWWFPARATNTGHIHSRSVSDLMTRAKKRAGIHDTDLTGHSLRHTFGTELVAEGVDLRTVQELMMHASLATTQIYTKIRPEQKQAGIRRLPDRFVPVHSGRRAA